MLVLSRKQHDAILIGDDIKITIVRIDRTQVRIGIEAPPHVNVLRQELVIQDNQLQAARDTWTASDHVEDLEVVAEGV